MMQSSGPGLGASARGNTHSDNEDAWGTAGALTWVLDGASRPPEAPPTEPVSGFVGRASAELAQYADSDLPLPVIVRRVIQASASDDVHTPEATLALIRRNGNTVEWLLLGRASIFIETGGSTVHLTDGRLATVCVAERAAWGAAVAADSGDVEAHWQTMFEAEQKLRNVPGGYWVLANVESAADHAMTGLIRDSGSVILTSDGVTDGAGIAYTSPAELVREVQGNPAEFISHLQSALTAAGRQRIDDATVAISRA